MIRVRLRLEPRKRKAATLIKFVNANSVFKSCTRSGNSQRPLTNVRLLNGDRGFSFERRRSIKIDPSGLASQCFIVPAQRQRAVTALAHCSRAAASSSNSLMKATRFRLICVLSTVKLSLFKLVRLELVMSTPAPLPSRASM